MKILAPSKIGFFNPGRLNDEEIELSFIARHPEFESIFQSIVQEPPDSIPQHHLIVGQRGMGKTSLLMRIAAELRKPTYANSWVALTFPEEQYNVDRLSKFWLNCLDALADALDREGRKDLAAELDTEIAGLDRNQQRDPQAIYTQFEKWCQRLYRRPVLLVDNLNLIFSKISRNEQHQLRAILMKKNAPIVLGASAAVPSETLDYGAPFYDSFSMHYLKKLSFEESMAILVNLGKITGAENYEEVVWKNKGRLRALYHLTGGTPRTLSMLFPLIRDGFSDNIQSDLDALLDVVTPIYKAKFEELSDQQQVILDAIALHWDPMTLAKLREVSQLENSVLSAQLKRLMDLGWIDKLEQEKKKFPAYEITERFFNVWYLMRRSRRLKKLEANRLTRFLESFFTKEDMVSSTNFSQSTSQLHKTTTMEKLENPFQLESHLSKGSESTVASEPNALANIYFNWGLEKLLDQYLNEENWKKCEDIIQTIEKNGDIELNYTRGILKLHSGNINEALMYLEKAKYKHSNDLLNNFFLSFLYGFNFQQHEKANSIIQDLDRLGNRSTPFWLYKTTVSYYNGNQDLVPYFLSQIKISVERADENVDPKEFWWISAAVVVRLGYGQHFLDQLAAHGYDSILRPYYVAIQALMHENADLFLNSVASEIREPARKILAFMKRYNQGHTIQKPKIV